MSQLRRFPFVPLAVIIGVAVLIAYSVARGRGGNGEGGTSVVQTLGPRSTVAPSVVFVSPNDGATVANPVTVRMAVAGVLLEPASVPAQPLQGHLQVIIDGAAPAAGQVMPQDATHVDLADGGHVVTLPALSPGAHTVTAVFANSDHVVPDPPMTATIRITVTN